MANNKHHKPSNKVQYSPANAFINFFCEKQQPTRDKYTMVLHACVRYVQLKHLMRN